MDYNILVNKDNPLPRAHIPSTLVEASSNYKDGILIDRETKNAFDRMKQDALRYGYHIDIESGYRDYDYQEKIYNKLLEEKGFTYAITRIAEPGKSEHQTGLAVDFCIYKDEKCYIEHEIEELLETKWVHQNCYRYGFLFRYPEGKEDITKYSYEPWHIRYVGNIASYIYNNNLTSRSDDNQTYPYPPLNRIVPFFPKSNRETRVHSFLYPDYLERISSGYSTIHVLNTQI